MATVVVGLVLTRDLALVLSAVQTGEPSPDALIFYARDCYAKDRIDADQLDVVIGQILHGEIDQYALRRLVDEMEASNAAKPIPEGVDDFDLPSGWWRRSDGTLIEIRGNH